MINPSPSTLTTWACLLMLTTASPLSAEKNGKYTIYKRQSSSVDPLVARAEPYTWPFPANKSSIVDQASEPKDNPQQDLQVTAQPVGTTDGQIPRKFIETKCDAGKKFKITEAWKEAKLLADAQTTFRIGYNYDIPHTQWLGKDWNSESSWIPWRWNFRKLIGDNFGRLARMYSNNAQKHEFIYWYCYDYSNQCTEGVQAYTWDSLGFFWSNHYTVFCNPFYDRMTLGDQINKYANNKHEQKVMENFHLNRGQIMFHETWHFKDLVSSPRAEDYAYQAQPVWDLAKNKGTNWAYVNADSYALDAVAIYVQQHYKSSMSPVPWRELGKLDSEAAAATSEPPADNARAKTFDGKPPGWTGPLPDTDNPDPAVWEEVKDGDSSGTCKLAITEIWTCEPAESNLYASVRITGADGKEIYTSPQSTQSPGQSINDAHSLSVQANGMKNALVITGEHTNDYIQFVYGSTSWRSGTTGGNAHCTLKGNDWNKSGPSGCPAPAIVSVLEFLRRSTNYANELGYNRHERLIANFLARWMNGVLDWLEASELGTELRAANETSFSEVKRPQANFDREAQYDEQSKHRLYMNTTIQKYYYDQIKRAGSLENDVDNFWVNLLPDYFQKRLNYGIERPLPEFTKHADLTIRYIRNGTSKKVVFMEDKCRGKETQSAQWRDALEQLTNYLRLVRAEPTQKPYEMLYGAVNIGTYTRFYQLEPFKQDCVDYPGTDGKPYELAEDEAEIHGILLDLVGKTSDQVPSDD